MSADWKTYTLEAVGRIVTGKTPPSRVNDSFVEAGVPFVTPRDMDGRRWIDTTERYLSENGVDSVKNSLVPANSVAVSCIGSDMGKAVLLVSDSVTNQQINSIIVDEELFNPKFVYYILSTKQQELKDIAGGSATPILNKGHFGKFEIRAPHKPLQDKIAQQLDLLDSKIELNRQTNKTLENIAQAIFKSWFVDFDPTRAKIVARENGQDPELAAMAAIAGKEVNELEALSAEQLEKLKSTAALFPDNFEDSELGQIPEGWETKLNGDVMDVRDGTHDSPKKSETGFPLVTSKHITSGVLKIEEAYLISEEDYEKVNKRSKVNRSDILMTMIGTVGIPYLVLQPEVNFAIKNVALFRTSEVAHLKNYFYLLLKSPDMQAYLEARMAGTTQKYLSLKTLRSIDMLVPTNELLTAFNDLVNPLMDKVFSALLETNDLVSLRGTLLPKLLSGEIDLVEQEKVVING